MKYKDYHGPEIESIDKQIAKFGMNPYGRPNYRFVLAECVTEIKGGEYNDWHKDTPIEDRGTPMVDPLTGERSAPYRPLRTAIEYREVRKYDEDTKQGWVLERWTPRHVYGSPEAWDDASHMVGGTQINRLGPYPYEGNYEWAIGPFAQVPEVGFLLDYITHCETVRQNIDSDLAKIVRQRYDDARREAAEKDRKLTEENAARLRDAMKPMLSNSLAAGRWRTEMFERAGFRSHVGN